MDDLIKFRYKSSQKICKLVTINGKVLDNDENICHELANEFRVNYMSTKTNVSEIDVAAYEKEYLEYNDL